MEMRPCMIALRFKRSLHGGFPDNEIQVFVFFKILRIAPGFKTCERIAGGEMLSIAEKAVGGSARKGYGILHTEVGDSLCEIMERLLVKAAHGHDSAVEFAERVAQRLVLRSTICPLYTNGYWRKK